jgi:hypothetical protein
MSDTINAVEWILKSDLSNPIPPETILAMIDRIRFLELRQTELQARNTELVQVNREFSMRQSTLEYLFETFEEDKEVVRSLMAKPHGVEPADDEVENRVMALYMLRLTQGDDSE